MVQVYLHSDSLLERFGRPVPDGVGLAASLRRLRARLEAGPRPVSLAIRAVRFDPAAVAAADREVERLPLHVVNGPERLPADSLFFTASHTRFREAGTAGRAVHMVGLGVPPEERGLDFTDVPRIIEEALRVPSPRPMSAAARKGGLIALPVAGPASARARALGVIRVDANADWIALGDTLIVYTEDPDLEDRLTTESGAEHLSYSVHKESIVLDLGPDTGARDVLLRRPGFALYTVGSRSTPEAAGRQAALPWSRARRRNLVPASHHATAAPPVPLTVEVFRAVRERYRHPLSAAVRSAADDPTSAMLAAIRHFKAPAAEADVLHLEGQPAALAWTTPYGDVTEHDELAVLVEETPTEVAVGTRDHDSLVRAVANALATAELICRFPTAPGALFVVSLRPETPIEDLWPPFLLVDERPRVLEVVPTTDEFARLTALKMLSEKR